MTPIGRYGFDRNPPSLAPSEAQMERVPDSLAIAFWIVGSCWALAIIIYLCGASTEWIFPLFGFGVFTGLAEWVLRRRGK
jgi:hypothetical protein